jgi:hypothetical protein
MVYCEWKLLPDKVNYIQYRLNVNSIWFAPKECREDIEEHETEIVSALDCANEILHDDNIEDKDKDAIKAYISELEIQLKVLHRQALHDEHRLVEHGARVGRGKETRSRVVSDITSTYYV